MRIAANLSTMFQDVQLIKRYGEAAKLGFNLVEISKPYSLSARELKEEADRHSMGHILINAPTDFSDYSSTSSLGSAALPSFQANFADTIATAIEYAKILDCKKVHVMAGIIEVDQHSSSTYLENITYACRTLAEHDVVCLIEPINHITIPGYFLSSYEQAVEICQHVGHPNLQILLDLFHAQQICGKLTHTLDMLSSFIGHIQIAQVPTRSAPDSNGEINYKYIFDLLRSRGDWDIGCEYYHTSESYDSMQWKHSLVQVVHVARYE